MTNTVIDTLLWRVSYNHRTILDLVRDMDEDNFNASPSSVAPPIGWHVWHIARTVDISQALIRNRSQVWEEENMVSAFQLDAAKLGRNQHGGTMNHEDAAMIPSIIGKQNILNYAQDVFELIVKALEDVEVEDLSMIVQNNTPNGKSHPLIANILFLINHGGRHLGMIEALIGVMFNREGTASI